MLKEKHTGGLAGHFWQDKTQAQLQSFYYWPRMQADVRSFVEICRICQYAEVITLYYINLYQYQIDHGTL